MNDCIAKSINFILSVIPWVKVAINHCTKFSIKQISRHRLLEYFFEKNSFLIYGKFPSSLSILNVCSEYNELDCFEHWNEYFFSDDNEFSV